MTPWLAVLLTGLVPPVPWIGLIPDWLVRQTSTGKIGLALVAGLVVDLWWGKPFGLTSLMIGAVALVVPTLEKWWPSSKLSFRVVSTLGSLIIAEGYLLLI